MHFPKESTIMVVVSTEPNSTSITIKIQRKLADAARLKKANRNDPRIKDLMAEVHHLAYERMNLVAA